MSNDTKDTFRTHAKESLVKRRINTVQQQHDELKARNSPVFVRITKKCVDAEKRLVAFITKSLSLDILFDVTAWI
ncbi:MAG: hypothetical protein C0490_03035 [Marivirga sp.]|nr:hypothetical protein [Marivirga sp.]